MNAILRANMVSKIEEFDKLERERQSVEYEIKTIENLIRCHAPHAPTKMTFWLRGETADDSKQVVIAEDAGITPSIIRNAFLPIVEEKLKTIQKKIDAL